MKSEINYEQNENEEIIECITYTGIVLITQAIKESKEGLPLRNWAKEVIKNEIEKEVELMDDIDRFFYAYKHLKEMKENQLTMESKLTQHETEIQNHETRIKNQETKLDSFVERVSERTKITSATRRRVDSTREAVIKKFGGGGYGANKFKEEYCEIHKYICSGIYISIRKDGVRGYGDLSEKEGWVIIKHLEDKFGVKAEDYEYD